MRAFILLFSLAMPMAMFCQAAAIVIDGAFDDWSPALSTYTDPPESNTGIDILEMQVTNDDYHLFINLMVDTELDLVDGLVPHQLFLYLDTDNNASTGFPAQSGYGTELGIDLADRNAFYNVTPTSQVGLESFGYRQAPTVTSTRFEIAIARNAIPDGATPLFSGNTIKVLIRELDGGDEMPDVGLSFAYTFDSTAVSFTPINTNKQDPTHLRITAYNVQNDGLIDPAQVDAIERIIRSISPDIIGFSECSSTTGAEVKALLDVWLPLGTPNGWYTIKDDYDLITASRWPFLGNWPGLSRQFPVLVDLPTSYSSDLLFINAHLNCCANDAARQAQADECASFILDAKNPGGQITLPQNTPFVMGGDLNLVGYAQQLNTLITGNIVDTGTWGNGGALDWDGTDLTDALPRQTHAPFSYTWRNDLGSFPPGRLDLLLHSDAVLTQELAYAIRTEVMDAQTLAIHGLNTNDSGTASDHLPLTVDYSVASVSASVQLEMRVLLEGPFDAVNMDDDLRLLGLIPLIEPYSSMGYTYIGGGGETVDMSVLILNGPNAIVDWVILELRSNLDPTQVIASRAALLQRDGDLVDLDGSSAVEFMVQPGGYFVAVKHRNHLGAMTAQPVALSAASTLLDLTNGSVSTFGTNAQKEVGGVYQLWAGDVNSDEALKYTGSGNDRDPILQIIGGSIPTNSIMGYHGEDVNMDGIVRYTGSNNDRDPILVNIGGSIPTDTRQAQLP